MKRRLQRWFSLRSRTRKGELVVGLVDRERLATAVFVGASAPGKDGYGGIVERITSDVVDVVAACNLDLQETPWPYLLGDGRCLPFRDGAVDLIVSNAVIEHVGDQNAQARFVAEHRRVARWTVMTTPNRWFPIESHTLRPFLHWWPAWRARQSDFTRLLSRREFRALLPDCEMIGRPWSATFTAYVPGA